jgi:glycosyltransferase involved in cell wall biosynthesis
MTKVLIVNPRAMHFGDRHATSIDLSVRDLVFQSRFLGETTVIGDPIDLPFEGIAYLARPMGPSDHFHFRMRRLLATIRAMAPDVISVQEHLGSANYLARRLETPVVLHLHNPVRQPKNAIERWWRRKAFAPLGGLIFVSRDHEQSFHDTWPLVATPCHVVPNGLDLAQWHPTVEREKVVLVVGRAIPEKGILEAAQALAATLPRHSDWRCVFILSAVASQPGYVAQVRSTLEPLGAQAELLTGQPFAIAKHWNERAAIAVISSYIRETFGRTALEAHAGGAAVISSGNGGLREVSGEHALYLARVGVHEIAQSVERLIANQAERNRLAAEGHAYALARFDIRTAAETHDAILKSLIFQQEAEKYSG